MSIQICSKVLAVELARTPRAALPRLTPPGSKDSKGNWALMGVRGVFTFKIKPSCGKKTSALDAQLQV